MRTTLCTLVFLFSLPWSLNGHLTTSHKNIEVTNTAENASRQRDYTIDSGTENVVSLSRSVQTQHLTSHTEQQGIRLRTTNVKTTERKEVTDKWTSTQGPELETSSMTKPKKTLTTTKKTTTKRSPPPSKDNQQANPGPAVAAVIGTTFVLMLIAIIFILVRKRKMQRRQLENPEWAGPSPFLDGDVQPNLPNMDESETINRQGFNQMSTSRYLSQRLSKHLTFGRNTSEDVLMGDILQGSTFGRQNPDEVQAPNGNPTTAQDSTETEENKIQEGQASVDSSDTKTPAPGSAQEPVMENKVSKQTDDLTPSLSSGPDTVIKPPPPLVSIDLDSLSEEAAPLQTSDGGIVPPAPPLP
uniref:Protein EVI2B-like n=1 Tax=Sinocyclocheilus anshuiensis TaxID=1608454 RepID=A0A671KVQ1_9TELE